VRISELFQVRLSSHLTSAADFSPSNALTKWRLSMKSNCSSPPMRKLRPDNSWTRRQSKFKRDGLPEKMASRASVNSSAHKKFSISSPQAAWVRSICASLFHQFDESFEMMLTSCGLGTASVVRDQPPANEDGYA